MRQARLADERHAPAVRAQVRARVKVDVAERVERGVGPSDLVPRARAHHQAFAGHPVSGLNADRWLLGRAVGRAPQGEVVGNAPAAVEEPWGATLVNLHRPERADSGVQVGCVNQRIEPARADDHVVLHPHHQLGEWSELVCRFTGAVQPAGPAEVDR